MINGFKKENNLDDFNADKLTNERRAFDSNQSAIISSLFDSEIP